MDGYQHVDVDGDRLRFAPAHVPGHGPGVYFRTDPNGSTVLIEDLAAIIAQIATCSYDATESWVED